MSKEKQQKCEYVIKILNGHGGCGVFLCNGETILGILQAMFAIDEELQLLLQKKEEIDGLLKTPEPSFNETKCVFCQFAFLVAIARCVSDSLRMCFPILR